MHGLVWSRGAVKTEAVDVILGIWLLSRTVPPPILISFYCGHHFWIPIEAALWNCMDAFFFLHVLLCESNKRVGSIMVLCNYDAMKF